MKMEHILFRNVDI